jgi:predicted nucleic acid-binding protein
MRAYWDSSALVQSHLDNTVHTRLRHEGAYTRTHSLSETFATLTGRAAIAMSANDAAAAIKGLLQYLELVDLTGPEVARAFAKAQSLGVRGGRVHDYVHALAAEKSGAKTLLTLDRNDFIGLVHSLSVEQL